MRVLGVIPARLGAERLPRKPLYEIAGHPLIEWVWRRVSVLSILDRVVVATDSPEVQEACRAFGAVVTLTAEDHPSGTHRVAEVIERSEHHAVDVAVNIQGDEPFVTESQIKGAVECVAAGWDVGTVAAPVGSLASWRDPSVVKLVRNPEGRALYFSRAPIPFVRDRTPSPAELASADFLRHIGVYAYSPEALRRWVALPPSALEQAERLEQLRPLAAGLTIGVAVVEPSEAGVDTMEDARRVEGLLRSEGSWNRKEAE